MYNLIYYRYTDLGTLFFLFLCWWWVVTISFFWADARLNLSNELCADEGLALSGAGGLYWQMLNFVCKWADNEKTMIIKAIYECVDSIFTWQSKTTWIIKKSVTDIASYLLVW